MEPFPAAENHELVRPLALVTGAAHRLGKVFALCLARQGYAIVLHYHNSAKAAETAAEEIRALGVPVYPIRANLANPKEISSLFSVIDSIISKSANGNLVLRALVNSAAVMERADARTTTVVEIDKTFEINLRAPFLCAQQAFQRMDSGGLIVNISDIAARKAWTAFPAYTVSKAGLEALTRVLARSFAPKVRVNAIAPGLAIQAEGMGPEEWDRLVNRLPFKRAASLDELGLALEFLLKNEYITGQVISVDGGYSLI